MRLDSVRTGSVEFRITCVRFALELFAKQIFELLNGREASSQHQTALTATQMALLFLLVVSMTTLSVDPTMLSTAAYSLVQEGSFMMNEMTGMALVLFKSVTSAISAIWCNWVAAGGIPRPI